MKIGDLVKYKDRYKETIGIIVDLKDVMRHDIGRMPYSCREVIVSWTSDNGGAWISTEDHGELEVVYATR
jgi:hypothetical protein